MTERQPHRREVGATGVDEGGDDTAGENEGNGDESRAVDDRLRETTGDQDGEQTSGTGQRRPGTAHCPEFDLNRRRFLGVAGSAGTAGLAGCLGGDDSDEDDPPGNGADDGGGNGTANGGGNGQDFDVERRFLPFRTDETGFQVEREGTFEPLHVQGVNLGMGAPGLFPGHAGITRDQYARWFEHIGDLGADAIRNYTIHPPAFYEELFRYNERTEDPLYLFHGTWIGEGLLHEAGDVTQVADQFHEELRRTVDVVHGEAVLEPRPGHASGEYRADISNYLLGYIAGIEWIPSFVVETNEAGGPGEYEGTYVETEDGSPFERWLAEALDVLAERADEEYGTQRPLSFVNWPTTGPLDHPHEPFDEEVMVTVDPDAIVPTDAFEAGIFGTYHVYPYYPPFMNHTPEYREYVDHRGEQNTYAGYLNALTDALDVPVLVGEFGVPDSRARAAEHVYGRHQGRHTETEQGDHVAAMVEDIAAEDTAGGLVFTWQDEWFKRTWNLAPLSDPDRRPYWSNVMTPEQRFGLLTFDPEDKIRLDGSPEDWADATTVAPTTPSRPLDDGHDDQRTLTELALTHDEAYFSIRLEFDSLADLDWSATNVLVAIGHTGRGNTTLPLETGVSVDPTDFLVHLAGPDDSHIRVDPYYNAFAFEYHDRADLDPAAFQVRDSGEFTPIRAPMTSDYTIPATGEEIPFRTLETGSLRFGNGNPAAEDFDSLADVHISRERDAIELRLPWLLLNVADPSTRRALGDFWAEDAITFEEFDELSVAGATIAPAADGTARPTDGDSNLIHAIPGVEGGHLDRVSYTWETWNEPRYVERLKASYSTVREAFRD